MMKSKHKWIIGCLILVLAIMFLRWVYGELDDARYGIVYYGKAKDMASLPVEQKVMLGFPSDQSPRFVYASRRNARYFWAVVNAERDTVVKWIERVCQEPGVYVSLYEVLSKKEKNILSSPASLFGRDMPYLALDPEAWQRDIDYWGIGRTHIFYNPATKQVLFYILQPNLDIEAAGPFLYLKRQ